MNPVDLVLLLFLLPVAWLLLAARSRGRAWAGGWLLVLAPLYVPLSEDGFLAVWLGLATPAMDPHGTAGLIEPHAAGHVVGAGVAAILLALVCVALARVPLRRGERWAWWTLAMVGAGTTLMGAVEIFGYFDHGLPGPALGAQGGFGWPLWIAGGIAWGSGLWLARAGLAPAD